LGHSGPYPAFEVLDPALGQVHPTSTVANAGRPWKTQTHTVLTLGQAPPYSVLQRLSIVHNPQRDLRTSRNFILRDLLASLADHYIQNAAGGYSPYDITPRGCAFAGEFSANYFDIHSDILSAHIRQSDTYVQSVGLPEWMLICLSVGAELGCEGCQ
jgi:hypothetical protein